METIRELMIEHGASIQYDDKKCTIRINRNYPFKIEIARVLRELRISIYSQEYLLNYCYQTLL